MSRFTLMRFRALHRQKRRGYVRLQRNVRGDHDESTFYCLEFRGRKRPLRYTTAREVHSGFELLGPPPLGL
jgi:hypothetical protein